MRTDKPSNGTKNSILRKIQKLLRLTSSPNENEAATAAELAQKLMLEHEIDVADTQVSSEIEDQEAISELEIISGGRIPNWITKLSSYVCMSFRCQNIIYPGKHIKFVGTKSNIAVAKLTFEYLYDTICRLATENAYGKGRSYVAAYKLGMAIRIGTRLYERYKEVKEEVFETASDNSKAVMRRRDDTLRRYINRKYRGTYRTSKQINNYQGYNQGYQDGGDVSLSRQLMSRSNKLIRQF